MISKIIGGNFPRFFQLVLSILDNSFPVQLQKLWLQTSYTIAQDKFNQDKLFGKALLSSESN